MSNQNELFNQVQEHKRQGQAAEESGKYVVADKSYRQSISILEDIVSSTQFNASLHDELCNLYLDTARNCGGRMNKYSQAADMYAKAVLNREKFAVQHPINTDEQDEHLAKILFLHGEACIGAGNETVGMSSKFRAYEMLGRLKEEGIALSDVSKTFYQQMCSLFLSPDHINHSNKEFLESMGKNETETDELDLSEQVEEYQEAIHFEKQSRELEESGQIMKAIQCIQKTIKLLEQVVEKYQNNCNYIHELAIAYSMAGRLMVLIDEENYLSMSEQYQKRAIRIFYDLKKIAPDDFNLVRDIVLCHRTMGDIQTVKKRYRKAAKHYKKGLYWAANTPKISDNMDLTQECALCLANLYCQNEKYRKAAFYYAACAEVGHILFLKNPGEWRSLAMIHYRLAYIYQKLDNKKDEARYLNDCYIILQKIRDAGIEFDEEIEQIYQSLQKRSPR